MRKFLLPAFCFVFLHIFSCSIGEVEPLPEATKFTMQNNSTVMLRNIVWNGTHFGDLELGWISEQTVSDGYSYVYFEMDNGNSYRTRELAIGQKHRNTKFTFIDGTVVIDTKNSNNVCSLLTCSNPSSSSNTQSSSSGEG